jgi:hypothetical protein
VRSVSSRLVIERRTGGDVIRYTKKQERYLSSEYKNSWKKLACICHLGDASTGASTGAPTDPFINAPRDPLLSQWVRRLLDRYQNYAIKDYTTTQTLIKCFEFSGLQIYKNLDMLILLLNQRFKAILGNAIDLDLAGNHLLGLHGSSAQSRNHTFIILPLIAQH